MRVLLSGGGTGGHIYPALAVIECLRAGGPVGRGGASWGSSPTPRSLSTLWVGSRDRVEADLVPRAGIPFRGIDAAGLRGMSPLQRLHNLVRLVRGTWQAYRLVGDFRPDVIFVTGGYVSAPVVVAGRMRRIPIVIYLPDVVPGLAIKRLAQLATWVAVSFEASRPYLPRDKVVVTGYPVRAELYATDSIQARRHLALQPDLKTLLVFGGSQGARRINQAVASALEDLLGVAQVIHVSGRLDFATMKQRRTSLSETLKTRYHLFDYLHEEMADALAAADLVVSRAGAATLGEFPAVGVPAVLVPGPFAGAHQAENAAVLVEAGGAMVIPDAELTGERLAVTMRGLLTDHRRLASMRHNMGRLAQPGAAQRIADLLRGFDGR